MFIWVAHKENVRLASILWITTEVCTNQVLFAGAVEKMTGTKVTQEKYQRLKPRRILMPKRYLHGLVTWKVMRRSAWKDIANWRIKQLSHFFKVATPCLDDHQYKEETIVTKSKSAAMNLSSHVRASSSSAKKPDCIQKSSNQARQARIDELSLHQERNPTTVSQLMTQIRT